MPDWLEPMAATLTQERFTGPDWMFERKFDGIRLLAFKHGADVRLFRATGLPQTSARRRRAPSRAFPSTTSILDGEMTWDGRSALSRVRHPVARRPRRHVAAARRAPRAAAASCRFEAPLQRVDARRRSTSRGSARGAKAGKA